MDERTAYKTRFENLFRLALKVTSSLNIGDVLEIIRDEAKAIVPNAREACLLMFDPEAEHYTRPLHCAVYADRINCQLCKRGRKTIQDAVEEPRIFQSSGLPGNAGPGQSEKPESGVSEVALPISDGNQSLAVLNVIAKDGQFLETRELALLNDLVDLATNAITNARSQRR
jgi:GAF domain-containing protein